MVTRIFKDHTCKAINCNKLAEKDRHGLYKTYCSDACNPRSKVRKCKLESCNNLQSKDVYGNYVAYCCNDCRTKGRLTNLQNTYASKDMDAVLVKRKATVQERYGVDNVAKTAKVKKKLKKIIKKTVKKRLATTKKNNLINYGVESTNSLQSVKDKKKETFMDRYGVDHQLKIPSVAASVSKKNKKNSGKRLSKARATTLKIYGDKNYNNRVKYKKTCYEKFGVENPSQNPVVHAKKMKTQYRKKKFIFPSGNVIYMMGYEPLALKELLRTYKESEIITATTEIPVIAYKEQDGSDHVYFPDIYIPKDNLLIEVKSRYTYSSRSAWLETNMLKQQASIDAGYNFKFMIY